VSDSVWIGQYEVRPKERVLLADGESVPLGGRAFDVLLALLDRRDRVVTKGELLDAAWPGSVVEENNLTVQISAIRKALGQDVIGTVPGRGYRVTATVNRERTSTSRSTPARPSIAVLPFANLSADQDQEYFADGLSEDIIANLSRSPWILVIARGSSFAYRGPDPDLAAIGRALDVRYILTGSVRRSAVKVRIAAELTVGESGETVWSGRYDRPIEDLFETQDEISAAIAGAIEPEFLRQEERLASRKAPRDLHHWDMLMRARWHYWRASRKHAAECRRILEQALVRKPEDATTLSLLAFSYLTEVWSGWADDPKQRISEACRYALKAVSLEDRDSFSHLTLGVAMACVGDMDRAIAEQRRALELQPNFAAAQAELGRLLAFSGQTAEAAAMVRRAMVASPGEPRMSLWLFTLAIAAFVDGNYDEALRHARDALAQRPDWFFNHYLLAACQSARGDLAAARAALDVGVELMPRFSEASLKVGHPFTQEEHRNRYLSALRNAGWKG
jgi:TolB-like protein